MAKARGPVDFEMHLDETCVSVDVPTRGLYRVPLKLERMSCIEEADDENASATALLEQDHVDITVWARPRGGPSTSHRSRPRASCAS